MNKKWPIKELDELVKNEILNFDFDRTFFTNEIDTEPFHDPNSIEQRINEIDLQINRIIDLYQIGSLTLDQITERMEKLKKERDMLSNNQVKLLNNANKEKVKDSFSISKYVFSKGTPDEQRLFVRSLIDCISINNDELDFQWSFL